MIFGLRTLLYKSLAHGKYKLYFGGATNLIPSIHRIPGALLAVLEVLDSGHPNAGRTEHLGIVRQKQSREL